LADYAPLLIHDNGTLSANITHFARALRKAGLPVGPGQIVDATRAVMATGFASREDLYWTLQACFVRRPDQRATYAEAFRLFWRDPKYLEHMMSLLIPQVRGTQEDRPPKPAERRAAEALLAGAEDRLPPPPEPVADMDRIDIDASATASDQERLKTLDFEQMTTAEMAMARDMLARLTLPVDPIHTRRAVAASQGRIDPRRTLRLAMRTEGEVIRLARKAPMDRWPNLVVICDISGSMAAYSRMILHFLHSVANRRGQGWARVHGFTFGTRLTNITRHMAARDVDAALARAGAEAQDWSGGTRIGACLHAFNRDWSRRVLGQGAVVLLITDGLDRGDPAQLRAEVQRLSLSCRRLIWLNPLLRFDGFAPRAAGIRAMLPHVDCLRAGHSVQSLAALAGVLAGARDAGDKPRLMAAMRDTPPTAG
jgi:uncharacterized protein